MKLSKIMNWCKEEFISILPVIIYFTIAFNLLHFASELMSKPGQVRYFTYGSVTIIALIVSKVILLAGNAFFLNVFPTKPLIYNITWKFFAYMVLIFLLWVADTFLHLYLRHNGFLPSCEKISADIFSPIFLSSYLCLAMVFLGYLIFSEFTRVLGKDVVKKILFG